MINFQCVPVIIMKVKKGNRKYFTVGAGFKMSVFSLDAGYVIATAKSNPLDQTLRFSLTFDMDGIKDLFHRKMKIRVDWI